MISYNITPEGILWAWAEIYLGPIILFVFAVIIFSYLTSIGKKRLGMRLGIAATLLAIVWLIINLVQ